MLPTRFYEHLPTSSRDEDLKAYLGISGYAGHIDHFTFLLVLSTAKSLIINVLIRLSLKTDFLFSFWSFEISEDNLRNLLSVKIHFLTNVERGFMLPNLNGHRRDFNSRNRGMAHPLCSLLLKDLSFYFYLLLLQLVLCRVAALKSLPVNHS